MGLRRVTGLSPIAEVHGRTYDEVPVPVPVAAWSPVRARAPNRSGG